MTSITDRISSHPFASALGASGVEALAACGSAVALSAGEAVFRVDQPADEFFLIEEGRVAVELDVVARPHLMINTVGPGEVLGVSWILPPFRWTFDARALEPTSALRIDAVRLRAMCETDPALGYRLYRSVAGLVRDRLVAARFQLLDLYGDHRD